MWFRTALLLIFWLLLFRWISALIKALSPRKEAPRDSAAPRKPSDVIDVPFEDVTDKGQGGSAA